MKCIYFCINTNSCNKTIYYVFNYLKLHLLRLKSLHWLPVRFRVDFKILMLTYKALHGLAPQYLSALLTLYTPKRLLRSSQAGLLVVPQTRLRSVGDRAFSSYAPRLWNALPLQIREAHNLSIFKSYLKTHFLGG